MLSLYNTLCFSGINGTCDQNELEYLKHILTFSKQWKELTEYVEALSLNYLQYRENIQLKTKEMILVQTLWVRVH